MRVPRLGVIGSVFLALALAGRTAAFGQETQPPLAPRELIGLIEAHGGYAFEAAAADIDLAKARLSSARAGLRPRLTLTTDAKVMESLAKTEPEDGDIYARLELIQPLYDFGRTSSLIKAARSDIAAAEEGLRAARNTVLLEGLAVFFELHASELRMHALNEDHARAYVRWDRARQRQKLGQVDAVEVAERQALVEKTRLAYYRERSKNRSLRLRLQDLSARPFNGELIDTPKPPARKPEEIEPKRLVALAMKRNPQITALELRAEALGFRRDGKHNQPRLEAFANAGQSNRDLRSRDAYAVGLRLTWSLFDGGEAEAERARLSAEQRRVLAQWEAMRRKLGLDVQKALLARADSWQQIVAAKANLAAAQRRLTKRRRLYEQERVADLGTAMVDVTLAEADLAQATGAYFFDSARLATLLGVSPARGLTDRFLTAILKGSDKP